LLSVNPAFTDILVTVDKPSQTVFVDVDGVQKYIWPTSTGAPGYDTPNGKYNATSMNEIWYSKKFDDSPMPHSVFFRTDGYAIHGTYSEKSLGRAVSHGCVRLSRENATTLYALVEEQGLDKTTVVVQGNLPSANPPLYNPPQQYQAPAQQYQMPPQQYQQQQPPRYYPQQPPQYYYPQNRQRDIYVRIGPFGFVIRIR
jgi:hypothetical protein